MEWANVALACIRGHNDVATTTSRVEDCQQLCEQQTEFSCRSIDFYPDSGACHLSRYNRDSVPSTDDFTQPCYLEGWIYSERLDLGKLQ